MTDGSLVNGRLTYFSGSSASVCSPSAKQRACCFAPSTLSRRTLSSGWFGLRSGGGERGRITDNPHPADSGRTAEAPANRRMGTVSGSSRRCIAAGRCREGTAWAWGSSCPRTTRCERTGCMAPAWGSSHRDNSMGVRRNACTPVPGPTTPGTARRGPNVQGTEETTFRKTRLVGSSQGSHGIARV